MLDLLLSLIKLSSALLAHQSRLLSLCHTPATSHSDFSHRNARQSKAATPPAGHLPAPIALICAILVNLRIDLLYSLQFFDQSIRG